ncbi:hypothetical protein BC833DRAFT_270519 [Globomyces pollinis-pini]|nr:hypothetical protein BC833DRAFT_270519 [Globomyces pollinis-pini]
MFKFINSDLTVLHLNSRPKVIAVRVLTLLFFIGTMVANRFASVGGNTIGSISNANRTWITPAAYAFSIWGLIYLGLLAFTIYQLLPSTYDNGVINNQINLWFIINLSFNIAWIFAWLNVQKTIAFLILASMAFSMFIIFVNFKRNETLKNRTWVEYLCVRFGFSLYLAWLSAASIVNLYSIGTSATEEFLFQAVIGLLLAFVLEISLSQFFKEPLISLVGTWALSAIAVSWFSQSLLIGVTAIVFASLLLLQTIQLIVFNNWKSYNPVLSSQNTVVLVE